jgi:hypothetical protein
MAPPSPVCQLEGRSAALGHWHAAASDVSYMLHYLVLKNRSGLSWTRSLASFQDHFGAEASCKRCCNPLRMCSHFVGRWRSNPASMSLVRGVQIFFFFRIHMLYPRPSTDIRSGGTKGMMEGKLPAHWRARNGLWFAPRLFSGSVGRGRHSENSLQKKTKTNYFLMESLDGVKGVVEGGLS